VNIPTALRGNWSVRDNVLAGSMAATPYGHSMGWEIRDIDTKQDKRGKITVLKQGEMAYGYQFTPTKGLVSNCVAIEFAYAAGAAISTNYGKLCHFEQLVMLDPRTMAAVKQIWSETKRGGKEPGISMEGGGVFLLGPEGTWPVFMAIANRDRKPQECYRFWDDKEYRLGPDKDENGRTVLERSVEGGWKSHGAIVAVLHTHPVSRRFSPVTTEFSFSSDFGVGSDVKTARETKWGMYLVATPFAEGPSSPGTRAQVYYYDARKNPAVTDAILGADYLIAPDPKQVLILKPACLK